MNIHPTHKCRNGHLGQFEFGDSLKMPCTQCSAPVFKFADFVSPDTTGLAPPQVAPASPKVARRWLESKGAIAIPVAAAIFMLLFFCAQKLPKYGEVGKHAAVVPLAIAQKPAEQNRDGGEVIASAVSNLQVEKLDGGSARLSFTLKSVGNIDGPYPSLTISWKGSKAEHINVPNTAYKHPEGALKEASVVLEVDCPVDATGVELTTH